MTILVRRKRMWMMKTALVLVVEEGDLRGRPVVDLLLW